MQRSLWREERWQEREVSPDPSILGLGFAATRDFVSYLRAIRMD